jgi:RHS repeat-associated protein
VRRTQTGGNTTREEWFGGDTQAIATGTLCSLTPPTCGTYRIDHTYQFGVRNTSRYVNTTTCPGTAMSFYTLDLDIDQSTGLPAASYQASTGTRDVDWVAGIKTSYVYDAMGRLTWEKPDPSHGAFTHNQYISYNACTNPANPAKVETCTKGNGTATECIDMTPDILNPGRYTCSPRSDRTTRSALHFDGFGRLTGEFTRYTGSAWNQRLTAYNGMGWITSVSEWQPSGTTDPNIKKSTYSGFDPFGRATTITPPDGSGHDVTMSYTGVRVASRTVKIATAVGTETNATTTEEYDCQGRLAKVTESSGYNGASVDTTYAYDAGSRLKQATTTAWVQELSQNVTQNRIFTYDNRGFLTTEQLPELGTTGNGTIAYSQYDARGHALRRYDGLNYLKYEFDKAERLYKVKESNSGWADVRTLRQFDYATANNGSDKRNGKLLTATATNMISTTAFPVVETYTYAGVGGRVSRRQTTVDGRTLTLDLTWNDLGRLSWQQYPDDSAIADPVRKVINTYTQGLLTGVCEGSAPPTCTTNYATPISYHPNVMVNAVQHANGVMVTYARDDNDMRRPKSIATSGAATNWSSGTYGYDGAGNIKTIGADTFTYDLVSRLKEGTTSAGAKRQCAGYNAFGTVSALATSTSACTASPISIDHAYNRLAESTSPLIDYSAAGDLLAWGGFIYTWDKLGQMAGVSGGGVTQRTYLYTAGGERIQERIGTPLSPSSVIVAARGLDNKVLRLFTKTGTNPPDWTRDYVYRDGLHVASIEPPVASPVVKHFHLDHLGTIRRITGTGTPAAVLASHDYYPYGLEATTAGQDTERMKFTGHERDLQGTSTVQTDDLDYMHARYYNPNVARFLSVDPVRGNPRKPQTFNLYAYVAGNPLRFVDPTGRTIELGTNLNQATEDLEKLRGIAGDGGKYLTLQSKKHSFLGLFKWTSYSVGTSNAGALAGSGNVGRALGEWIGASQALNFKWGASEATNIGGGAATTYGRFGATISIDPARVNGATIGGVTQSIASALVHELGHSLYALHSGLEASSAAGAYGTINRALYPALSLAPLREPFPIAFENSWRPADQQRPDYYYSGDYTPPAQLPVPLW